MSRSIEEIRNALQMCIPGPTFNGCFRQVREAIDELEQLRNDHSESEKQLIDTVNELSDDLADREKTIEHWRGIMASQADEIAEMKRTWTSPHEQCAVCTRRRLGWAEAQTTPFERIHKAVVASFDDNWSCDDEENAMEKMYKSILNAPVDDEPLTEDEQRAAPQWQSLTCDRCKAPLSLPDSIQTGRCDLCRQHDFNFERRATKPTKRQSWHDYFLQIAQVVSTRATCKRKQVGAVLVRNNQILSTGYNGSPSGDPHCTDIECLMEDGHCVRTVHAEANAIAQAAKNGVRIEDATLYCTLQPCARCAKLLRSAGVVSQKWSTDV